MKILRFILTKKNLFLFSLIVFLSDQISKNWVVNTIGQNRQIEVWRKYLTLCYVENDGIVFGLFQNTFEKFSLAGFIVLAVVFVLTVVLFTVFCRYLLKRRLNNFLATVGLALFVGGSLSNLLDRFSDGAVIDWIESAYWWGPFNIADFFISLGIGLFVLNFMWIFPYLLSNHLMNLHE